jgi:hypothetical protein
LYELTLNFAVILLVIINLKITEVHEENSTGELTDGVFTMDLRAGAEGDGQGYVC